MNNAIGEYEYFHPLITEWFKSSYNSPTDIQKKAWPLISSGKNLLVSAPTGTGKTLTAFLWALNQLISGVWTNGGVRVLYISPLKALNTDIKENLLQPLQQLKQLFKKRGVEIPAIRVLTRSGDTPFNERRQMVSHPPEILITTPESLNLILSSPKARSMLNGIKTVILDEIHAVVSDKRGVFLMSAIERLTLICGEFQRIALSATVHPLEKVAEYVGGYHIETFEGAVHYKSRPVHIVSSAEVKKIQIHIEGAHFSASEVKGEDALWQTIADRIRGIIDQNRATLIFVNNRRLAERLSLYINENTECPAVYSHHGSLSKELRLTVEKKLKNGELKGIVATSSLEMGIDVGYVDCVVLVQTPPQVSSTLQRIGRAGHSIDRVSIGKIIPTHGMDFLNAAVMSNLAMNGSIEEVRLVYNPLDILAQVLLSMIGVDSWNIDNLYNFIKTCSSFSSLSKMQFDSVLMMLAGKYQETRVRELNPRIIIDPVDNTVHIRSGMLNLLYSNSGTIPDKGYYELRVSGSDALIGELDEEFVWERRTGDTFMIGTQSWKIEDIGDKAVKVSLYHGKASMSPFWKADANNRSFHVSESISGFLENWNNRIDTDEFTQVLIKNYCMDFSAAEALSSYLQFQKKFTGETLPHRHHLIIEHVTDAENSLDKYTILHTLWGNRVNYPFMLAFSAAWEERFKKHLETYSSNDTIYLQGHISKEVICALIDSTNLHDFLVKSIQNTSFFGARFRENSSRALLLPRLNRNRRMPLWVTRQRAKKLFDHVAQYKDFPLIFETWRTCLNDEFDLVSLRMVLDELSSGKIDVSVVNTSVPSPFSGFVKWQVTNKMLYEDDTPHATAANTTMHRDLMQEVINTPSMRPEVTVESIRYLQKRLQRTMEGYAPASALELLDWLRERRCIPATEWVELLQGIMFDNNKSGEEIIGTVQSDICCVTLPNAKVECYTTIDGLADISRCFKLLPDQLQIHDGFGNLFPRDKLQRCLKKFNKTGLLKGDTGTVQDFIGQWLQYYGPVPPSFIREIFGLTEHEYDHTVKYLIENKKAVADIIIAGEHGQHLCDIENFERLLRIIRNTSRAAFKPLPGSHLPLFFAHYQGLTKSYSGIDALKESLGRLFGLPCKYNIWESDILSSRVSDYIPSMLDILFREHEIQWFGYGKKQIAFRLLSDETLILVNSGAKEPETVFPDKHAKYTFIDLLTIGKTDSANLSRVLWKDVWAGSITNDTFESVRRWNDEKSAITGGSQLNKQENTNFALNATISQRKPESFNAWRARLDPGNWYVINRCTVPDDPLVLHEQQKERVRILLNRYGILFRELLIHEMPGFQWSSLFRTIRLMELSGEIVNGQFFEGIPGLQFTSVTALKILQEKLPQDALYWINAADPISLCGIPIPALKSCFPERLQSTHLFFHGERLVMISRRMLNSIQCNFSVDDKNASLYIGLLKKMAERSVGAVNPLRIEFINGMKVYDNNDYTEVFINNGFFRDYKYLSYWTM